MQSNDASFFWRASNDPIGSNDYGECGGGDYDDGSGQTMIVKKLSTVC